MTTSSTTPLLEVEGLSVVYDGSVVALDDVSLSVPDGGVVSLLGHNGAGKSTCLRAISGLLGFHGGAVTTGDVRFAGRSILRTSASEIVRAGLVQVPEGRRLFASMTVEDNLRAGGLASRDGQVASRIKEVYEQFPILHSRQAQKAGFLSGGEQQMLAIGRALVSGPRLILMDEPSLGLAPQLVDQVGQIVADINARKDVAVLLIEQNAAMALRVSSSAYVMATGRVLESSDGDLEVDRVRSLLMGAPTTAEGAAR